MKQGLVHYESRHRTKDEESNWHVDGRRRMEKRQRNKTADDLGKRIRERDIRKRRVSGQRAEIATVVILEVKYCME